MYDLKQEDHSLYSLTQRDDKFEVSHLEDYFAKKKLMEDTGYCEDFLYLFVDSQTQGLNDLRNALRAQKFLFTKIR